MTDDTKILELNKVKLVEGDEIAESPEVTELNIFNNLKQTLERLAGKKYILAYIDEANGAPNIMPSEEISDIELVYLAEMIKFMIFATSEIEPIA